MENQTNATAETVQKGLKNPQNKNGLIIIGIIVILVVLYFATNENTEVGMQQASSTQTEQMAEETEEQDQTEKLAEVEAMDKEPIKPSPTPTDAMQIKNPDAKQASTAAGSDKTFSLTGMLRLSDNPAKGNLVLMSKTGNIFLQTSKDYTGLLGKEVELSATGEIESFKITQILAAGSSKTETDKLAMGGDNETVTADKAKVLGQFTFTGKLAKAASGDKGNYLIASDAVTVYLSSSQDYSALIGKEVTLTAQGDIKSFKEARLRLK